MNCKICGKNKECDTCYECYLKSMGKWYSEDNGKDVLLRLERKINDLRDEIIKIQDVINTRLPQSKKIRSKTDWDGLF